MGGVLFAIDNSPVSKHVAEAAVKLSKILGNEAVGVHGYNTPLHEKAFRIMEPILPEEYKEKTFLSRQREFHDQVMRATMEKISFSYLEPYGELFEREGLPYRWVAREGKNFSAILEVAKEVSADLIVIGAYGFNRVREGFLGSTCLRVIRAFSGDTLVVKEPVNFRRIVVCLDGSSSSLQTLRRAVEIGKEMCEELHLLYVYDTNLHRFIFEKLKHFMYHAGGVTFKSEEQERLHDEFIDKGLGKVGEMVVERGKEVVKEMGFGGKVIPALVEDFIYEGICKYASEVDADLVFLGKTGRHHTEETDIGSVAENVVRYAPTSVFLGGFKGSPEWDL